MGNEINKTVIFTRMNRVKAYLNLQPWQYPAARSEHEMSAEVMRIRAGNDIVRDYDAIFDFYMRTMDFEACARDAGVRMRKRNRVVEMWPMRVKKEPGEEGAKEDFERVMASRSTGTGRARSGRGPQMGIRPCTRTGWTWKGCCGRRRSNQGQ